MNTSNHRGDGLQKEHARSETLRSAAKASGPCGGAAGHPLDLSIFLLLWIRVTPSSKGYGGDQGNLLKFDLKSVESLAYTRHSTNIRPLLLGREASCVQGSSPDTPDGTCKSLNVCAYGSSMCTSVSYELTKREFA